MTTYKIDSLKTNTMLVKLNLNYIFSQLSLSSSTPFYPESEEFYKARALFLQTMSMLGWTAEVLIKAVLLNRGISIISLENPNKTIDFKQAIKEFKNTNTSDYFNGIKSFSFDDNYTYFGYRVLNSHDALIIMRKLRGNYLHSTNAQSELNIVRWYLFNFLLFIAKKEFANEFSQLDFIGNEQVKKLFKL